MSNEYSFTDLESGIYKLERTVSLFDYVHDALVNGPNKVDKEQLDNALFELSISQHEALKVNFEELLMFLKKGEM